MTRRVVLADAAVPLISKVEKIEGPEPGKGEVDWHPSTMEKPSPKIETIKLAEIVRDPSLNCRVKIDPEIVDQYAEALDRLPPISVFQVDGEHLLVDGSHRVAAHEKKGQETIQATVYKGSRRDALLFAAGAYGGLRRTQADKRRAVRALLSDPNWWLESNRWIANQCGVGHELVATVRTQMDESSTAASRRGKGGKSDGPKGSAPKRRRRSAFEKLVRSIAGVAAVIAKRAPKVLEAGKAQPGGLPKEARDSAHQRLTAGRDALAKLSEAVLATNGGVE